MSMPPGYRRMYWTPGPGRGTLATMNEPTLSPTANGSNALLILICLEQLMVVLDVSIVNVGDRRGARPFHRRRSPALTDQEVQAMQLLVTGGTGHLGQVVVSGLEREGHGVRVLARRPRNDHHVEWVAGDLATGEGVEKAVVDIDVIVHAATNSPAAQRGRFSPRDF